MFKAVLVIILFSTDSGAIRSVYTQNGLLPGFESQEACEIVLQQDLHRITPSPESGLSVYAQCIAPKVDDEVTA